MSDPLAELFKDERFARLSAALNFPTRTGFSGGPRTEVLCVDLYWLMEQAAKAPDLLRSAAGEIAYLREILRECAMNTGTPGDEVTAEVIAAIPGDIERLSAIAGKGVIENGKLRKAIKALMEESGAVEGNPDSDSPAEKLARAALKGEGT